MEGEHRLGFEGDDVSHEKQHYKSWVQNPDQEAEQRAGEGDKQGPKCLENKNVVWGYGLPCQPMQIVSSAPHPCFDCGMVSSGASVSSH